MSDLNVVYLNVLYQECAVVTFKKRKMKKKKTSCISGGDECIMN